MRYQDSDIDAMLQGIGALEDAPDQGEQSPATVAPVPPVVEPAPIAAPASVVEAAAVLEPVTSLGRPNIVAVVPGQSNADLFTYLKCWMLVNNREKEAALLVYAGVLGSTAPKQEDYSDADVYRAAYSQWLDRCTVWQRQLLDAARERKAGRRRASERAEYAQKVKDERGIAVREYVTGLSPEDRAERKRQQDAERAKRYRDRKKAESGAT